MKDPADRNPADVAADVHRELDTHLALQIDDLVAEGWTREAATEEALRRFGDRARVERELVDFGRRRILRARRRGLVADLIQDVRLALRQLRRQRAFAAAVIAVIALGVGAAAAVFAVVDAALLRPLPFRDGDQLVYLWGDQGGKRINASLPEFRDWAGEARFIDGAIALATTPVRWRSEAGWQVSFAAMLTGNVTRVLRTDPLLGRWFTAAELRSDARVLLLDETAWRERFGARPDIVGTRLSLDRGPYTIIGVAPRETILLRGGGADARVALWLPLGEAPWMTRDMHFLRVVARLRRGVDRDAAVAETAALAGRLQAAGLTRLGITVQPVRAFLAADATPMFYALAGGALFVLLTVCANLGNLFLWKSLARGREFAVRAALGATRGRLIRQVLTESLVIGVLGGLGGLLLSDLLIDYTRAVVDRAGALAPGSSADPRIVVFCAGLSIVVGLSFGLWPALRASRKNLADELKRDAAQLTTRAAAPLRRKALVAVEIALGVMLIAGSILLVRSLSLMLDEDPGFVADRVTVVDVSLPQERYDDAAIGRATAELRARLLAIPGVAAAGIISELPLSGSDVTGGFEVVGRQYRDGEQPEVQKRLVGPGYFDAMRIPLRAGRDFRDSDRAGAIDVVVISETLAREQFPGGDPIGQRVRFLWGPGDEQVIVGVVGDVRHDGFDQPPRAMVYRPIAQMPRHDLTFVVRTTIDPDGLAGAIRREVAAVDPALALSEMSPLTDVVDRALAGRRSLVAVLTGFAAIALVLAAIGAYAVTSQVVHLRAREIGLRLACGARPADILALVAREGGMVIAAGAALGLAGTLATTRILSALLYGVTPRDPVSLAFAVAAMVAIATVAVIVPARRAAATDPMVALR